MRNSKTLIVKVLSAAMLVFVFSLSMLLPKDVSASSPDWGSVLKNSESWFGSTDGIALADSIVQYQLSDGGWRKDMTESTTGSWGKSTIDNDTTTSQITCLARTYKQTNNSKYLTSCQRGIDLLLNGQYSNGGWPQVFSDPGTYHAHITYNDNAMVHVMNLLTSVSNKSGDFTFIDSNRASRASTAVQKGIQCFLNTQITDNGIKTAWCQQHDEYTLKPATGRAYELPSTCASESVNIVNYLKTIQNPSNEIKNAINSAVSWMKKVQINGIKVVTTDSDRVVVSDPNASPIWARFYELGTNRPVFFDRDSSTHYQLSELSQERRAGYAWYGDWPAKLISSTPIIEDPVYDIVVAKDGSGNYTTVQAAINSVPDNSATRTTIYIKNGVYKEKMNIGSSKRLISFIGQSKDNTILTYDDGASTPKSSGGTLGTTGSASITIAGEGFQAENITFENSYNEAANGSSQAVAVLAKADKMIFNNCAFKGNQDTLYANSGRQFYTNCYIEGDVDFIFGAANAVFYNCEVLSLNRSGGCITAPSTKAGQKGYLFYKCRLTCSSGTPNNISLGRPWIPSSDTSTITPKVLFRECDLGYHISSAGWTSMSGNYPDNYDMWEYLNTGAGANSSRKQLPSYMEAEYTMEKYLSGTDGWDPNTSEIEQPQTPLDGKNIKSLTIYDTSNAADWSIQDNVQVGDLVFGDRTVKFISLPEYLIGSEYIRTACDSKLLTSKEASFTASSDITCYIGLDTRLTTIPSWLSDWTNTGNTFDNDGSVTFNVYKKDFSANSVVELGTNGGSKSVVNYVPFVKENNTQKIILGDINQDGNIDAIDYALIKKHLLGIETLEGDAFKAADVDNNGAVDSIDLARIKMYLLGAITGF